MNNQRETSMADARQIAGLHGPTLVIMFKAELPWQLRSQAAQRQVENARLALQHDLGLGGACVVTLIEKGDV